MMMAAAHDVPLFFVPVDVAVAWRTNPVLSVQATAVTIMGAAPIAAPFRMIIAVISVMLGRLQQGICHFSSEMGLSERLGERQ